MKLMLGIKDIQTFLGHSSAKITMDTYIHLTNRTNSSTVHKITKKLNFIKHLKYYKKGD